MNNRIVLSVALAWVALGWSKMPTILVESGASWAESGADLDFFGHYYVPVDQMLFLGLGSGYRQYGQEVQVPLTGALYLRLPMGRTLMPVFQADMGYHFGEDHSFLWSTELLADLKLGDHSSLVFGGGIEGDAFSGAQIRKNLRAGVLIEY